jgi:hypothetical protein
MANTAATTSTINIVPVQGIFQPEPTFDLVTLIGPAGTPFYANINPVQSGLTITNSTINSSVIGGSVPAAGTFTNIATTTGTITTAPSAANDIVNKLYVDYLAAGLSWKQPVNAASMANITSLSGLQTIDTVSLVAGNTVLVKNQTAAADNGIYLVSSGAWTRSIGADTWNELVGAIVFVVDGSQGGSAWYCTAQPGGTLGVTANNWSNFSVSATYTAGTGLTLTGTVFSITPVGTAGTYGSASQVPVFVTNASGQISSVTNTAIAIANTQVSGLGTMSTQNANAVAITGGTINGATIGASTAAAITGTTVTASSYFSGPGTNLTGTASGLSIGGNAATATSAGSVTNSLTINSGGAGGTSPQTFNGGTAITISYNTVGAPSTTGTNASGTWGIGISGNAATVTNGLYSTGSYSNPTWLTSISGSIVSGAVATATTATNVAGGAAGSLVYQTAAATTSTLALGTTNYVLTAGASAPQYVAQSTLSVGSATTATTATNLAGGGAGYVPYQSGAGATAFLAAGTTGQVLTSNGTSAPTWSTPSSYATVTDDTTTAGTRYPLFANQTTGNLSTEYVSSTKLQYNPSTGVFTSTSFTGAGTGLTGTAASLSIGGNAATATSATSATTATNLAGGANGSVPYQTGSGATTFLAAGTNGYVMTLAAGVPTWAASASSGITISDDTTTNATRYLTFTSATSGSITSENVSSTKLQFNPSSGNLTSTIGTFNTLTSAASTALTIQSDGTNAAVIDTSQNVSLSSTGALKLNVGTTAQRPSPAAGQIRYNSTNTQVEYSDGTYWYGLTGTNLSIYSASYFMVAGGGAGSQDRGGGGGAGGYLTGTTSLVQGTVYTVTVGAGGTANGGSGSNSSITGLTAAVGGGGAGAFGNGSSGGSGGGAGYTGSGGAGTSGQGNAGGSAYNNASTIADGGGGGGASAVGGNGVSNTAGSGGAGVATSISGSSVTYAGGGGGSFDNRTPGTAGSGGSGGGGAGGALNSNGTAGTANTGGGGGGGSGGIPAMNGANGGSGIVIISVPTANYTGTTTGSPTVTTNGAYKVLTFTGSGSYTA